MHNHLITIAELSVDVVNACRGKYPDELLQAFTLIAKYMTIAGLEKEIRKDMSLITTAQYCPLCHLFKHALCQGCVLKSPEGPGCGRRFDAVHAALTGGTFTDVAFNLSGIIRSSLRAYVKKRSA